jgi:two-component system, sporulation sensor kinase D
VSVRLFGHNKSYSAYFVLAAVLVAIMSLVVSDVLIRRLSEEERKKIEIWAMSTEMIAKEDSGDLSLILKILQSNTTIPIILHDLNTDEYVSHNIKSGRADDNGYLKLKARKFEKRHNPIVLENTNQILYYDDSYTLKQLQVYPYVQLFVIALFIGLAFFALNRSGKAEQNKVWVGLSRETAHQLGTPISSLMAWVEYLKIKDGDSEIAREIGKDVGRLQMISERFSKIGSYGDIEDVEVDEFMVDAVSYMKNRVSNGVLISYHELGSPVAVKLNKTLFSWVVENLIKNSVDAMRGEGKIDISVEENSGFVLIDFKDTGKGIAKSKYKEVFSPGYTTKDRGWGLGLSLVKRIVEVYHGGNVFVQESMIDVGTTIRIMLKKVGSL